MNQIFWLLIILSIIPFAFALAMIANAAKLQIGIPSVINIAIEKVGTSKKRILILLIAFSILFSLGVLGIDRKSIEIKASSGIWDQTNWK